MKELFENTILIVDDTPENIDILVELLEDFDKQIAINGVDALETAFEDPPDLILLDIMMPEMDGYEVCGKLRQDERTKDIPIIFLTAKALKDDIVKGFEVGGQDYITKPFDYRELMERVKTQLELRSQREVLKNMNEILEEKVQERTAQLDTANKELEKANTELLGLDKAKNSFLMMISHELRTPLNGIVGASEFLNIELSEDKELGEFVEILKISVDRLDYFSSTALLITQLDSNYKLDKEKISLNELIDECVDENKEKAKAKGIPILKAVTSEISLNAERALLKRVINSILDNAIKYSDEKQRIQLIASLEGTQITINCEDEGSGFSEQALDNLFTPFGLGEKHYDQNVGLSLRVAKQIMEAHGGEIKAKNRDKKGASVSLAISV